jgi:hypothetical protein
MSQFASLYHYPVPTVLGLALVLQGLVAGPCFGGHMWKHGTVTVSSSPIVPMTMVTPVVPLYTTTTTVAPVATVAPSYVAPMVPAYVHAVPAYYSVPTFPYPAATAVAPTYYTGYAPGATAATPQAASLPVAPMSFLASFNPDVPMVPGVAGYDPAMPQAKGSRILQGLRNVLLANRSMIFGSLAQVAAQLFAQEFGFAPNAQDVSILTGLVTRVLDDVTGGAASNPPSGEVTNPATSNPGTSNQGAQSLVITITLPSNAKIAVQPSGTGWQPGGAQSGATTSRPGSNPSGTSGAPGNP